MTRKRSARLLLLGGLALALGCRAAPPAPDPIPAGSDLLPPGLPLPTELPLVLNGPPSALPGGLPAVPPGEPRPFSQAPAEPVAPKPMPPKIPPATTLEAKDGPALPAVPPPPAEIAVIPPAPKLLPTTSPDLLPIPADGVKLPDVFVSGPKEPAPPFELSIVGPPRDTTPPALVYPLKAGEKFGHAADYKWVAGVLDRHQRGGYWTLRYADASEDDRWGGKVRLLDDAKVKEFKSGDVVVLEGELLAPASAAGAAGTFPPYRVTGAKLVEKGR